MFCLQTIHPIMLKGSFISRSNHSLATVPSVSRFRCRRSLNTLAACLLAGIFAGQIHAASVKDFGAVGDGLADDTAAIQAAINQAVTDEETLEIPSGRYLIQEHIQIQGKVAFAGAGHEESVITSNGGHYRLFIHASDTSFRDIGFEDMVEPIVLKSREDYELENVLFERCRFQDHYVTSDKKGVIGLESGKSRERPYIIRNLVIKDSIFRDINAHAINIRANIIATQILNNEFINIVNPRGDNDMDGKGGYAIRLGESSDDRGTLETFADQGDHLIEGNLIRHMRKQTVPGNLKAMLLYGNRIMVRNNKIEDIGGDDSQDDVNAMYIRGAYNELVGNTILNITGADDDGAIAFKGGLDLGAEHNRMSGNHIENIYGLSAVETSSSNFVFTDNSIINATTRGFQQRSGSGLTLTDNLFRYADTSIRSIGEEVVITGNEYINSMIILGERRGFPADRESVHIHDNIFRRTEGSETRMVMLGNDVQENFVSIQDNRFEYSSDDISQGSIIYLTGNGVVERVDIIGNLVLKEEFHDLDFSVDSPEENISNNIFGLIDDTAYQPIPAVAPEDFALLRSNDDRLTLSWTAVEGLSYQLEFSTDMKTWNAHEEPILGNGENVTLQSLPQNEEKAVLYRLRIVSLDPGIT